MILFYFFSFKMLKSFSPYMRNNIMFLNSNFIKTHGSTRKFSKLETILVNFLINVIKNNSFDFNPAEKINSTLIIFDTRTFKIKLSLKTFFFYQPMKIKYIQVSHLLKAFFFLHPNVLYDWFIAKSVVSAAGTVSYVTDIFIGYMSDYLLLDAKKLLFLC